MADDGRKRRVGAMLNAYYRIEGSQPKEPAANVGDTSLDRQGFDASQYFDSMVAAGQLPDLVKRKTDLDSEILKLDADMQVLVYENYSKFVKATDVIRMMNGSIDGLEPDIQKLHNHLGRIDEHQHRVDNGISGRASQLEVLLKQQRVCQKLKVVFNLPDTLRRCLDHGQYGKMVEAYCCVTPFLRQYKDNTTFQKVLDEVELQMGRIRSALDERLRSPGLSVHEAVNSSLTLLDLGEEQLEVATKYLTGRVAVLQSSLEKCFEVNGSVTPQTTSDLSKDQQELQRPESLALHGACSRAVEAKAGYVTHLCDAVEGFQKLQEGRTQAALEGSEDALEKFVSARVQEFCGRLLQLVEKKCPPSRVLVSCIHCVRDALRRLHFIMPHLLTQLFKSFLSSIAQEALKAIFSVASAALVADLARLHAESKRLQGSAKASLDDILGSTLEEVGKTEKSIMMHCFTALMECQPLLHLIGNDKPACQQLVRGLHGQLVGFFFVFVDVCHAYLRGQEWVAIQIEALDPSLASVCRPARPGFDEIIGLDWSGLFGLALVRIGRHFESKAIGKVWAVARDYFAAGVDASSCDLQPNAAVIKATRAAAQATITHYVLTSGQRLSHFLRNSIQAKNWMTMREPRGPRFPIEMVLKEAYAFDAQLARILGDPRKPRVERRSLNRVKDSFELEMERLLAKKLQVFAPVPFNRNGAVASILKIAYKALCEYVREETFAMFGLQQIQVDCAFLADVTREFVEAEDAGVLDSLLDEAVTSASRRCVNAELMDAAKVEALCDEKKKTFKYE